MLTPPNQDLPSLAPPSQILTDAILLAAAGLVVGLSALLDVHHGSRVVLPFVPWPLPPTCIYQNLWGLDCPGCGLTRCFVSLAHGQWSMAWKYHPVGIVLFVFIVVQIPYRSWKIWRIRTQRGEIRIGGGGWTMLLFLVLLVGQWVLRAVMGRL